MTENISLKEMTLEKENTSPTRLMLNSLGALGLQVLVVKSKKSNMIRMDSQLVKKSPKKIMIPMIL